MPAHMPRHMPSRLLALLFLAGLPMAGSPALAASPLPGSAPASVSQSSPWVDVTTASDLVGRRLRDNAGKEVGRIDRVVLDLEKGTVPYVLVGSGGALQIGRDVLLVPFRDVRIPPVRGVADVVAGSTGEAQPALERAEVRLLNRSSLAGRTEMLGRGPTVERVKAALDALASGDRERAMGLIQWTLTDIPG